MKKLPRLQDYFDMDNPSVRALDELRPIMQEKAQTYSAVKIKKNRTAIIAICIIVLAIVIVLASATPSIIMATRYKQYEFMGETSVIFSDINFKQQFGKSGSNGLYYYSKTDINASKVIEKVFYDISKPQILIYQQDFFDKKGKNILRLYVSDKSSKSGIVNYINNETAYNYKGIKYNYLSRELIFSGVACAMQYGNYDYYVVWQDANYNAAKIHAYLDKLFLLA